DDEERPLVREEAERQSGRGTGLVVTQPVLGHRRLRPGVGQVALTDACAATLLPHSEPSKRITIVRAEDPRSARRVGSSRCADGGSMSQSPGTKYKVGYFVGSLFSTSVNPILSRSLIRLAPPDLEFTEIPIGNLPLYSPDHDADYPPEAQALKDAIAASDALLFVTPEYNRSIPGALKNAIDWASRPWGKNSFARKPSAMIGTSPGMIGTAVGQQHLKSILSFCNSPQMNAVEAYIQFTPGLITEEGEVQVGTTQEFLSTYMREFHGFVTRVYTALPRAQAVAANG